MSSDTEVKALVRERYAEVAKAAGGCCADDVCGTPTALYDNGQIDGLPSEALMASAGCGNPTAIDDLKPGDTVVDFGSGGGIDCFIAAKAVGEQGRVIGVDMTPDMVDLARRNAATLGMTNVAFHLTEMESTPIAADSVDVIISNCVINLAPDKDAVFREAYRILKPGGRMFISDMLLTAPLPDYAVADMRNWVACLSGTEPQDVYLGRMRQAGFERMEIVDDKPWQGEQEWASRVHSMNIKAYKPA
ncbi:MAG: arsenite methyltransferase [Candidatus Tectomicrobia bacterium]|nr:arsenite methyltransferase [Candidatus Tectomicrobia bacterium]